MKASEKIKLLLSGVSMNDVKALEDQEAKESEESKNNPKDDPKDDPKPADDPKPSDDPKPADDPTDALKKLVDEAKADIVEELLKQIGVANAKSKTVKDSDDNYSSVDVMKELFCNETKEEKK